MHMGLFAVTCQEMMQHYLSGWCLVAILVMTRVKNCSGGRMTAVSCHIAHVTDRQIVFRLGHGIVGHFLCLDVGRFMI